MPGVQVFGMPLCYSTNGRTSDMSFNNILRKQDRFQTLLEYLNKSVRQTIFLNCVA